MHSYHSGKKREIRWKGTQTEQGAPCRNVTFFEEGRKLFLSPAQEDSLTEDYKRTLGLIDHLSGTANLCIVKRLLRDIASDEIAFLVFEFYQSVLCILRKIQYHRAFPSGIGDMEGSCNRPGHIFSTTYLVVPFCNRACKADDISFLKGISSKSTHCDLSGDYHQRSGVRHCIRDSRNKVGCSRA